MLYMHPSLLVLTNTESFCRVMWAARAGSLFLCTVEDEAVDTRERGNFTLGSDVGARSVDDLQPLTWHALPQGLGIHAWASVSPAHLLACQAAQKRTVAPSGAPP